MCQCVQYSRNGCLLGRLPCILIIFCIASMDALNGRRMGRSQMMRPRATTVRRKRPTDHRRRRTKRRARSRKQLPGRAMPFFCFLKAVLNAHSRCISPMVPPWAENAPIGGPVCPKSGKIQEGTLRKAGAVRPPLRGALFSDSENWCSQALDLLCSQPPAYRVCVCG